MNISELLRESLQDTDEIPALHIALFLRTADAAKRLEAARTLYSALEQDSLEHKLRAIETAGIIAADDPELTSRLAAFTRSKNPRIRFRAVAALSRLREPGPMAIRALQNASYDEERQVAARAANSLEAKRMISTDTAQLLEELHSEELKNSDESLFRLATAMGYRAAPREAREPRELKEKYAPPAAGLLMRTATLPKPPPAKEPTREQTRHAHAVFILLARPLTGEALEAAKRKLHAIPEEVIIRTASEALQSGNPGLRLGAAEALSEFHPQNETVVFALKEAMADHDVSVKAGAMRALQAIAGAGGSAS